MEQHQHRPLEIRQLDIRSQKIELQVPVNPDQILTDAVEGTSKDPYWGKVWDSAPHAAACVLDTTWPAGTTALELGCGCGLLGIAAMFAGLDVTLSDHDTEAVDLAVANARRNGFGNSQGLVLDWNHPPEFTCDLLLASDVLYEEQFHQPILAAASRLLTKAGTFRIGDPGRQLAKSFLQSASDDGWKTQIYDADLLPVLQPSTNEFQWLVLSR